MYQLLKYTKMALVRPQLNPFDKGIKLVTNFCKYKWGYIKGPKYFLFFFFFFFFFFCYPRPYPQHTEFPRLGVESELQPPAYPKATATQDLSCICKLHHCPWQRPIPNPLSGARNWTRNFMVTSQIRFHCPTMGTPSFPF